jgi:hypothetical protein
MYGVGKVFLLFFFFFFFFYWAPVAGAPGSTAAMKAYCTSPALEVPACTARNPTPTTRETSGREKGKYGREMSG